MDHDDYYDTPRSHKRKADRFESSKSLKKNKCRASKSKWTPEEDEILTKAVMMNGEGNWKKIAQSLHDRSHLQCLHRWQKVLNPALVKGPWKEEEDLKLVELVEKYGPKDWSTIASHIQGRIGKQCRERWFNHLSPEVRKTNWTPEEDQIIIDAHQKLGNKWTAISKLLDGRPANAIKNHWNSTLLKRIQTMDTSSMAPRRERSKIKKIGDYKDYKELSHSPIISSKEISHHTIPQSHYSIPLPSHNSQHHNSPQTVPQSSPVMHSHSLSHSHAHLQTPSMCMPAQDPSLVLFGDQALVSWDWPTPAHTTSHTISISSSNQLPAHSASQVGVTYGMNMGVVGVNMGVSGVNMATEFGLDQSPDFMDMYQTQGITCLPELQFCFDHSPLSSSTEGYDSSYSPMSLDNNMATSVNLNMNLLNLEMPGYCSLDI